MLECSWDIEPDEECCPEASGLEPEVIAAAVAEASAIMSRLSGYTVGLCSDTLRPLTPCQKCRGFCCGATDGIRLEPKSGLWVHEVTEVKLGAQVYAASDYYFDEDYQMLWHAPGGKWPRKDERFSAPGTGEAFVVEVVLGSEPDAWALGVAQELVCELLKSCGGAKNCRIPKNAVQVVGQGVSVQLSDQELKTLIPEVAGWVEAVNPHNAVLPARIMSSDLANSYRGVSGGCCGY